jgi:DNA-binding CsgD family transcriptional regulator/tetratricopeptide (TPR) repeat protein
VTLPFVGRASELAGLHAALGEARQGRTAAVFVSGEPGVGKSRLLGEFADAVVADGVLVLSGTCVDVGEDAPLWPVVDAVARLLRGPRGEWAGTLLAPVAPQLRQLRAIAGGSPSAGTDPAAGPTAAAGGNGGAGSPDLSALEVLLQTVVALAAHGPVALVLEDLQWADRSTRNLIVFLLANLSFEPVLLVCSYRMDALGGGHPLRRLLGELRRNRRLRWVDLQPLERAAVAALVHSAVGEADAEGALELVWSRGEGHPLYTEEFLHALTNGDVTAVPQTLRELLVSQVELLPPAARQVVRAVATGFEPVEHEVLAEVVGPIDEDLLTAIRAAVEGLVLDVDPDSRGYRLRHGFFREVVEAELLPGESRGLHERHAQALGRRPGAGHVHLARLAHHWQRAGDASRAFDALVVAAQDAEDLYGFAEAYHYWSSALSLFDAATTGLTRAAVLERAAQNAHLSANHEDAVGLLRQRLTLVPASAYDERRVLLARSGEYLLAAGRVREAVDVYEQAAALPSSDADGRGQVAVLEGRAEALLAAGRYADARAVAGRALSLSTASQESGSPQASGSAQALSILGVSKAYLEDHSAGLADLRESLRIAQTTQQPYLVGRDYLHLAEILAGPLNEPDDGVAVALEGAQRVTDLGLGRSFGVRLLAVAANGLFRLGRWDQAEQVVNQALARNPVGPEAVDARLARCRLLVGRGQLEVAQADLEALDALTAEDIGPRFRGPLLTLRAGLAMWQQRYDTARDAIEMGLASATGDSDDVWLLATLVWHGLRVEAEAGDQPRSSPEGGRGRVDRLREHVVRMAEQAAGSPAVRRSVQGFLDLCVGELSRIGGSSDPEAWSRAATTWQAQRHPYPAAYAMLRQAEALFAERTRNAAAAELLTSAAETATRLGAGPMLEQCRSLAARARVRLAPSDLVSLAPPVAAAAAGPAAGHSAGHSAGHVPEPADRAPGGGSEAAALATVTPRELDVLARLAEGLTNREIGKQLFISEKTVSVHVSRILAKLGVRTRVQATTLYLRQR